MTASDSDRESAKTATSLPAAELGAAGEKKSPDDFGPAPDGGTRAWLVAVGAMFVFFSALGYANSFGVLQQYYATHQLRDRSPDEVAWIGSLSVFLQLGCGAIGGPLFDRFGALVMRPAAFLMVLLMMMLSLCREYWHFMLVQGVLLGATMGLVMFPAITAVAQFFDKKRAAALGLAISGSSVGGVVIPIALSKMLNGSSIGFGWAIRIIAFLILPLLAFSCVTIKARLPPRTTNFFIASAFTEKTFLTLIASSFFMFLGMFTPLFFIPEYAVSRGIDATLASYMIAIINGASTFGRIIPGILADKYGKLNIFAAGAFSTGVVILCMTKAETTAALVVYSLAFGFTSGTIISGASASFTICPKDPRDLGTYAGTGMAVSAIAALIGPPVNGKFIARYGGFWEVSIFSGVMCLVGGCIVLVSKTTTRPGLLGNI